MSNTRTLVGKGHDQKSQSETVEVLYQKMGNRWFAFSLVEDEVFVGSIAQSEIDAPEPKKPLHPRHKIVGNS